YRAPTNSQKRPCSPAARAARAAVNEGSPNSSRSRHSMRSRPASTYFSTSSGSVSLAKRAQNGHSRSENITITTGASTGPNTCGPPGRGRPSCPIGPTADSFNVGTSRAGSPALGRKNEAPAANRAHARASTNQGVRERQNGVGCEVESVTTPMLGATPQPPEGKMRTTAKERGPTTEVVG